MEGFNKEWKDEVLLYLQPNNLARIAKNTDSNWVHWFVVQMLGLLVKAVELARFNTVSGGATMEDCAGVLQRGIFRNLSCSNTYDRKSRLENSPIPADCTKNTIHVLKLRSS